MVAMPSGQDGAEGGPGRHSRAFPSAATTALSRACRRVRGMGGEKSALSLHVRVTSSSMVLGKATCEAAFTSH